MKKYLILMAFVAATAQAQRLTVQKPTVDVGKTGFQQPVTAVFELKNKSSRKLVISQVKTDCGCTQVQLPKKELSGNEKMTLRLTYDARLLGHFQKQAAVYHNGSQSPTWLTMKGVVLEDVQDRSKDYPYQIGQMLLDKDVLEFDDVMKNTHPEQVINIYNNGSDVMTPNVMHLPPYLTAVSTPEKLKPGREGKITVTLNSDRIHQYGLTQTSVFVGSRLGEKVNSDNEMPVSVVVLPDTKTFEGINRQQAPHLELSDSVLTLGLIDGKRKKSEVITITNSGQSPLNISSLQMFTTGLKLTLGKRLLNPGEQTKLKVTAYRSELMKVRQRPRVLMITNDPDRPKVVITIHVK